MQINTENLTLIAQDKSPYGWDLYADKNGYLWSKAKSGDPRGDSGYGNKSHILKLMHDDLKYNTSWFADKTFTEAGREFLSGFHYQHYTHKDGDFWIARMGEHLAH